MLKHLTERALDPTSWADVLSVSYVGVGLFGRSERAIRRIERLIRAWRGNPDAAERRG
jgi:hypothetical protein